MDPAKVEELKAVLVRRDHIIREQWVKAMEVRILQQELSKCQKSEGVNHYENCKEWSERYLNLLGESKMVGYKQIEV